MFKVEFRDRAMDRTASDSFCSSSWTSSKTSSTLRYKQNENEIIVCDTSENERNRNRDLKRRIRFATDTMDSVYLI